MNENQVLKENDSQAMDGLNVPYLNMSGSDSMGSYTRLRFQNKASSFASFLILLRAITGIGFLSTQYYFNNIGYVLALLLILLSFILIGYCSTLFLQVCNQIESGNTIFINSYEEVMLNLSQNDKANKIMYYITKVCLALFHFSILIINFINLSKFLHRYISPLTNNPILNNLLFYKLIVILVVLGLLVCFISPEQLQLPSKISFFFIFIIILCLWIKTGVSNSHKHISVKAFVGRHFLSFLGSIFYSVEGISSIATIRSTMKTPSKMGKVTPFIY
jgi:amino acid permease